MSDHSEYGIVVNDEEQYSIWPCEELVPPGWDSLEFTGTKEACLRRIDEIWTDLRPRSLRVAAEES